MIAPKFAEAGNENDGFCCGGFCGTVRQRVIAMRPGLAMDLCFKDTGILFRRARGQFLQR